MAEGAPVEDSDGATLEDFLRANPDSPILLDGALATHLETLAPHTPLHPTLWSAATLHTAPSLIEAAHADYYRAGAAVAITASYQASVPALREHLSLTSDAAAAALIGHSVTLARSAAARVRAERKASATADVAPLLVAASIGPYGAALADGSEYTAAYASTSDPDALLAQLRAFHAPRVRALADAGASLFALETQPCAAEVRVLLALLAEMAPRARAWVSFVLDGADPTRLPDGTGLADAVRALDGDPRVLAVGVNCVAPAAVAPALRACAAAWPGLPLVAYPNSGEGWDAGRGEWTGERVGSGLSVAMVREWLDIGARLVGGCCRTGPDDVRALGECMRQWEEEQRQQQASKGRMGL